MRVLDLFAGIGGASLGLEMASLEFQTVAFCEKDEMCRRVLKKHWPDVPIYDDIKTLKGSNIGEVDIICGGYPCQPFSLAGQRRGKRDDRHLWPEMFRLVRECRPTWVLGENVTGHVTMGLDEALADLESEGYACRAFLIPAVGLDAQHKRERVRIVAHRAKTERERAGIARPRRDGSANCRVIDGSERLWESEPNVGRVANGVPGRTHRIRQLGNADVPKVMETFGNAILYAEMVS